VRRAIVILAAFFTVAAVLPPRRLHLAAIAPEGTHWAAALRRFSHEVQKATEGRLVLKWTLGGMGGNEPTLLRRILDDDLDGAAGAILCERLAPSLRVLQLIGFAGSDREADALFAGLRPHLEEEVRTTPFRVLGVSLGFGHRVLISRRAVRDLDELRHGRWWVWGSDQLLVSQLQQMGVPVVPLPLDQAAAAFDDGRVDGFIVVPGAAVGYGLYTRARWFTDLSSAYLPGCLVMSARSFGALAPDEQAALRTAAARLRREFEHTERKIAGDLDGSFANGLREAPMSAQFRADFFAAGRSAVDKMGDKLVPPSLVKEAREILRQAK
jgi:TRAP-type C4-dicarboxylate transport system substrate-binding protein